MKDIHAKGRRESVCFFQVLGGVKLYALRLGRHQQDAVREGECEVEFVGRDEDRLALLMRQLPKQPQH